MQIVDVINIVQTAYQTISIIQILDIDECESNPCEFLCVNTVGSYVCASGHITRDDGTVEGERVFSGCKSRLV